MSILTDRSRLLTALTATMLAASALVTPFAGAQSGSADVTFEEQTSGGTTVLVAEATLPNGGFVAIHDASLGDGKVLQSVVGASTYLDSGTHEDVRVHLSEPLTEDTDLIAMPHKDSDGDQIYSFTADGGQSDGPYTAGGEAVTDDAPVTVSASVNATDQPTDGGSVVVDRVEMAEGGFVAVHDDRLLEGMPLASVIGVSSFLESGVHNNVRVSLDTQITGNETIIPMPHEDSDDDQTYDFVTSGGTEDGPYTNHTGQAVIDTAQVTHSDTATATFETQPTGGHLVDVAEVFLPEGGFVTIHDSSLAGGATFDSVRGTSECLDPGVHRHLQVELHKTLEEDDTLIAMPHKDTDNDCEYDFVTSNGNDDGPYTDDDGIVTDDGDATVSASVHYHAQESDGHKITVAYADLSEGGFIAVHTPALLAGEVTGSVVGHSSYLEAGSYRDVEITLDEPIRTTQQLIPMPHKDTDGDQSYTFVESGGSADGPYIDGSGNAVVDLAPTTVRSQVTLADQDSTGTVTVGSATLHDGGFVTLHDGSLLDGKPLASVVGTSDKLDPGTHEDLAIELDDVPEGEATIIAMHHMDTNDNGAYDFVTSEGQDDGPYTASGGAVVHPATVTFPASSDDGSADDGATDDGATDDGATDGGTNDGASGDGASDSDGQDAPAPGMAVFVAVLAGVALILGKRRRG